ncbi:threonine/serine exporter [Clostridium botulinum]|uniref:Putative membrane protein n=1 Tax=Clostridium botulinum (strain Okra / Type B1) TaxID=498213 RepID=B1IH76_CLOBK|nr:threonine/serine exporter family protein [Clostridium botulinum]ACA46737.1 putative membrane protein [Clostridium botulinum B1 str. Okra]MBD5561725.1 threonine/serine exporter family protein [Clostridium botulinum]MBD5565391.1 threonine/serine exporter family protein [Clostridium botulinum]MBD5570603.1 threonine/serine exporter family protein [Clostridium botulinum]MBD5574876.1 threonine/serine exporter family protein [Clostridium botulinum]
MWKNIIQVLMAGVGTLGFTLFFSVAKKHVPAATFGGLLSWTIYLVIYHITGSIFLGNMIASMIVCLWSELMARKLKAPTNIFMIPGIIPLLPGGTLYYTMEAMLQRNKKVFVQKGLETVMITVGIVAGIVAVSVILVYFFTLLKKYKENLNSKLTC